MEHTLNPDILSNGSSGAFSGTLLISSDGLITPQGDTTGAQCRMDSGKTVISCTSTGTDGSINLAVVTKDSPFYAVADLAGTWHLNHVMGTPSGPLWARAELTINPDGTVTQSSNRSNGSSSTSYYTLLVSSDGLITIQGDTTGAQCRMDSGKTVIACTSTGTDGSIGLAVVTEDSSPLNPSLLSVTTWVYFDRLVGAGDNQFLVCKGSDALPGSYYLSQNGDEVHFYLGV